MLQLNSYINGLVIVSDKIKNPSLLNGKMGLVYLFYHLSQSKKDNFHTEVADQMLDELTHTLGMHLPLDFNNGLVGIGWGIAKLMNEGFIGSEDDSVLDEFDDILIDYGGNFAHQLSVDINLGVTGYLLYVVERLENITDENKQKKLVSLGHKLLLRLRNQVDDIINTKQLKEIEFHIIANLLTKTIKHQAFYDKSIEVLALLDHIISTSYISMSYFNQYQLILALKKMDNKKYTNGLLKRHLLTFRYSYDVKLKKMASNINDESLIFTEVIKEFYNLLLIDIDRQLSERRLQASQIKDLNFGFNNGIALAIWLNEFPENNLIPLNFAR